MSKLSIGFSSNYASIYSRPLHEAKEVDRVARFVRSEENDKLARIVAASPELYAALNDCIDALRVHAPEAWALTQASIIISHIDEK